MFWEGHKIWPIFLSFLTLLNSNYKWAKFLWPSQDMWTLWYLLQRLNQKLEGLFDFFRAIWNGVNYFFFLFCLLSGAHRPHCPKATKLTYVWCNFKKNLYNSKWCMNKKKYKACLSQSISATKKQRNSDFISWNYQIINKNYKPSISTLHLCEKKQKKYVSIIAY